MGIQDPRHFIFEINVGKSRIRHTTTLKLNDELLDRLQIDLRVPPSANFDFEIYGSWSVQ